MMKEERRERPAAATGKIKVCLDQSIKWHLPFCERETCEEAGTATVQSAPFLC